jgi:hypothetical protein
VAVLSVEGEDVTLLNAADVAVTCAPSLYASAEAGHPRISSKTAVSHDTLSDPDGHPSSPLATDITRRRADILVRRATPEGRGVVTESSVLKGQVKVRLDKNPDSPPAEMSVENINVIRSDRPNRPKTVDAEEGEPKEAAEKPAEVKSANGENGENGGGHRPRHRHRPRNKPQE